MAALARSDKVEQALARDDLRERVANWKSRFFAATWARYDLAKPGTFRLVPPDSRLSELKRDYQKMRQMFITSSKGAGSTISIVENLESRINQKRIA
nr:MetaGeneMark_Unknown Function [uncultured bacterium]